MTDQAPASPWPGKVKGLGATLNRLSPLIGLGLFVGAIFLLHHQLERYHIRDLERALATLPLARVGAAVLLTMLSYMVLTGYDALAVRYIGHRLPFRRIVFAAFEGFAFSQSFALGGLTGASIRYRLYAGWGLSAAEVAALVVFNTLSFWLGSFVLGGGVLVIEPAALPPALHSHAFALRLFGVLFLGLAAAFFTAISIWRRPWVVARWQFRPPRPALALGQLVVSTLDWSLAGSVLYVLLPPGTIPYPFFLGTFLLAQIAGFLSNVPGGLGVFETLMVTSLAQRVPVGPLLAALVVFRLVYYLFPLLTAATLLAVVEIAPRKSVAKTAPTAGRFSDLAPPVLAMAVFLTGVVLLISGATPAEAGRLHELSHFVSLPFVELSHFMASVVGAALLLLARGLQRRQRGSLLVAAVLMGAGMVFSLLKGLDYEEAAFLALVLGLLASCRGAFYRRGSLLDETFTTPWTVAVLVAIAGTTWLAIFANRHADYSAQLWWQFAFNANAPRSLRAEVGVALVLVFAAGVRLLRSPRLPGGAVSGDIDRIRPIVARERSTTACLALLGDKRFLFSASGECALMYGARRRSWIALGDPIGGLDDEKRELIWAFRELSDRNGSWAAFYEVGPDHAATYRDLGLGHFILGEEARVPLETFTLEGQSRRSLRGAYNRGQREGLNFEILPRDSVHAALPELGQISADWLASKSTGEKGFSLGFFDTRYLQNFPIAIVRQGDKTLAFANILEGAGLEELSFDLMRHRLEAPHGVMDYLLVELMFWGKRGGYRWFNLGMAPLAGLTSGPVTPLWDRAGAFLFRHGEHFYNFEGLRAYKAKFDPVWSPRYLACPGGAAMPFILADIAVLVSGGAGRLVAGHPRPRRDLRATAIPLP